MNEFRSWRLPIVAIVGLAAGGCLSGEGQSGPSNGGSKSDPSSQPNNPPSISGNPASAVLVGDVYSFTPFASDIDGDSLSFSIANTPNWAAFDSTTGRLSGQVLLGDVGVYDQIRITVSDGNSSRSMPDFSITVSQSASGSMTLSWTPPTENTDGSALTDLAGHNLYYGNSRGSYPNQVHIDNPSISTYVIENLLPDTYYVVATSFNTSGIESSFSNEAVKSVAAN